MNGWRSLALVLLACVISACGGGGGGSSPPPATPPVTSPPPTTPPPSNPPPANAAPTAVNDSYPGLRDSTLTVFRPQISVRLLGPLRLAYEYLQYNRNDNSRERLPNFHITTGEQRFYLLVD